MKKKTTLADDADAALIYRLRRDLEDLENRMVETIHVIALGIDGARTELVLTGPGDVIARPARPTRAEQLARRAQRHADRPGQLLIEFPDAEHCQM